MISGGYMEDKRTIGIRRLKNEASRIVEEVREGQREYVVTKRGEPVAVIRPWREEDSRLERQDRVAAVLERLAAVAERVGEASGGRGAVEAVSRQRR